MSDWRLTNQEKYLSGKRLLKKQFVPTERNDHEHCRFCWERFDKVNHPDAYCTEDESASMIRLIESSISSISSVRTSIR